MPPSEIKQPLRQTRLLVYGIGNPDRGDDAQGPAVLTWLKDHEKEFPAWQLQLEEPFQLQPESLYELADNDAVLFIDGDMELERGIHLQRLRPQAQPSAFITHALAPGHLLALYRQVLEKEPPIAYLLSLSVSDASLGLEMTPRAQQNIAQAKSVLADLLQKNLSEWKEGTFSQALAAF